MKKTSIRIFLCAVLGLLFSYAWFDASGVEPADSLSLSEVVLFGVRPVKELEKVMYRKEGRQCVKAYLDAIPPKSYLWHHKGPSGPAVAVDVRRRNLVEQIVAILGESVRKEAKSFAYALPLLAEWEGMSEGPVNEADFADQWLSKRPDTPIASFIHLFNAHRLRAGYEAARARHEKGLWPILAKRYRESLGKARASANPLIACIASVVRPTLLYIY